MRSFALALLAASAIGGASAPHGAAARPIIVLVHGRGQLGQDTAALRREWKRDLDSSLTLVGVPRLRDEDVRLAWYADVLDPDSEWEGRCGPARTSDDSLGFGDVARGFLGLLASAVPADESREVRGLVGDLLYALEPSKRCDAERRVGGVIEAALRENRPVIVVAYSLGSLVAYGYLESRSRDANVPGNLRLVTIGSPLGVRVIRELIYGEGSDSLHVPSGVVSWENVYDPNDFFSAPLEGVLSPRTIRDRPTHATEREDPHNLSRYLRDRATGAAVMRAICETERKEIAACAAY